MQINSYHSYTEVKLHKTGNEKKNDNFYFGFELEVECRTHSRYDVADGVDEVDEKFNTNAFKIEKDGSLNNGIEFVSQPMTLDAHKAFPWKKLARYLSRKGCVSHDTNTCGFHVHISKDGFKNVRHQERFGFFLYTQRRLAAAICRRGYGSYCRQKHDVNPEKPDRNVLNIRGGHNERYYAVNYRNDHTIEFRQPRGTLKYETMMATIEFMHAVARYTAREKLYILAGEQSRSLKRFLALIAMPENKNRYANLIALLESKGYEVSGEVYWRDI